MMSSSACTDHPEKQWPEMVACNVETMGAMLADFRQTAAAALR
jgi:hypothetical protein